jgi:hypothetical protein
MGRRLSNLRCSNPTQRGKEGEIARKRKRTRQKRE